MVCFLPGSYYLSREKAVGSAALLQLLPHGRKHQEWGRRVPPTLSLVLITLKHTVFKAEYEVPCMSYDCMCMFY
jgi:hypothetical protein